MPWARGALPPPPILWGTSLCFKQGRAAKTFRMPLKVLKCSEGPSSMHHLFWALSLPEGLQRHLRGGDMKGSLWSLLCASPHWAWCSYRAGIRTQFPEGGSKAREGEGKRKARDCPPDSEHPKGRDHLY